MFIFTQACNGVVWVVNMFITAHETALCEGSDDSDDDFDYAGAAKRAQDLRISALIKEPLVPANALTSKNTATRLFDALTLIIANINANHIACASINGYSGNSIFAIMVQQNRVGEIIAFTEQPRRAAGAARPRPSLVVDNFNKGGAPLIAAQGRPVLSKIAPFGLQGSSNTAALTE